MTIDTRNSDSLRSTLPPVPGEVDWLLAMNTVRSASAAKRLIQMQATRGCIGSLPISREEDLVVALRLLPGVALADCPVIHTMSETIDPLTIAPRLAYTIAGRLAQMDVASPVWEITEEMNAVLVALGGEFGDAGATARVVDRIPLARKETIPQKRSSILFGAIDEALPWCEVMRGAWSLSGEEVVPWADDMIQKYPHEPIVQRLYVASHTMQKTGRDLRDVAWRLIESDIVYDANYTGDILGPAFGLWNLNALADSVAAVEADSPAQPPLRRALWEANRAFVTKPEKYDGELHLDIARFLSGSDPTAAYTQACNAAACAARARSRKKRDAAVAVAHQLAVANQWTEIEKTLAVI